MTMTKAKKALSLPLTLAMALAMVPGMAAGNAAPEGDILIDSSTAATKWTGSNGGTAK